MNVMLCVIWYHLHNLKHMENTHEGVLLLISITPSWVFLTFFKLYKWYQITQSVSNVSFPAQEIDTLPLRLLVVEFIVVL